MNTKTLLHPPGQILSLYAWCLLAGLTSPDAAAQSPLADDSLSVALPESGFTESIERAAELISGEPDAEALAEEIHETGSRRVDVNNADAADLLTIPYLDAMQLKSLVDHIATYGDILSPYELLGVPGFDSALIVRITPFLKLDPGSAIPAATPGNLLRFARHSLMVRGGVSFPLTDSYTADSGSSGRYPGSPLRLNFRYTYSWFGKLSAGIAGEKDPGEQFFRGAQRNGMDYYAFHLSLHDIGVLKNLTLGNFRASFGQGLTLGSGISRGPSPGYADGPRQPPGIRPSLAMNEGSYLRGIAAVIRVPYFEISLFLSRHRRDATPSATDSLTGRLLTVSSMSATGYHRTPNELARKNVIRETLAGGNVTWRFSLGHACAGRLVITGIYSQYSAAVTPEQEVYNRFAFSGNKNVNMGLEWRIRWNGWYLFGEAAISRNRGTAWLAGVTVSPAYGTGVTVVCRNYGFRYQDLFAGAGGQGSLNAGERGICVSAVTGPVRGITVTGYADLFSYTWLRYRLDQPGNGLESGAAISWKPAQGVETTLRWYGKWVPVNRTPADSDLMRKAGETRTTGWRFGLEWTPRPGLEFQSRFEIRKGGTSPGVSHTGYLVYHEVRSVLKSGRAGITFRLSLFDIPDYDCRIYTWEPGVPYSLSVPAIQGRGTEFLLLLRIPLVKKTDLWLRAALRRPSTRTNTGTGSGQTEGGISTELTGQLMVRL
ncbi:MAG TPA: helix-hairpin-helix domain-containing protein [Bacteroidales bacterium]|nr:helix-hairpin-helix domain-containing protein [Bacteroidales bacterium]